MIAIAVRIIISCSSNISSHLHCPISISVIGVMIIVFSLLPRTASAKMLFAFYAMALTYDCLLSLAEKCGLGQFYMVTKKVNVCNFQSFFGKRLRKGNSFILHCLVPLVTRLSYKFTIWLKYIIFLFTCQLSSYCINKLNTEVSIYLKIPSYSASFHWLFQFHLFKIKFIFSLSGLQNTE